MIFHYRDGIYSLARITGPTYNLLCIKLASENVGKVAVTALSEEPPINITLDEVHRQVTEGIKYINANRQSGFYVSEVQYVPSNTFSPTVYRNLIIEIAKRIEKIALSDSSQSHIT
ncbi:hypothetical protein [Vibrio sagamiensis]|uniref:Uncharacterized protein n=1 Tax=Vibrio sagamiensis NBRC 104589 TaxID=1219064 RepID=A0A511QI49_9VIBR|nr:hypothetical protein [Vibrio sagamiensis]PNQ66917.1 hypothetical protein C1141_08415 [Vibrio agarivorans]GEM76847.1 hypothetical protein VSA01S_29590 [Vibrio sagamiensis NBRC 104589]